MVRGCWVNFRCRGVLLIWIIVGQGPITLAIGAGGGCLDIFSLNYHFSFLSPSLWETARYRLKYCLKGPLNPEQPTNQYIIRLGIAVDRVILRHTRLSPIFIVPRRNAKGTIVLGSSFRPSVVTILSPQLLLQFSRDLDETFSYCSHDLKMIVFYRCHARLIFTRVMAL